MTYSCHSCNAVFESYLELALHISASKKGHKHGKVWAARYLIKNNLKRDLPQRNPMTEEEKEKRAENIKDSKIQLSGKFKAVQTYCPSCKSTGFQSLEVEYVRSPLAWRNRDSLVVMCSGCRK